MAISTKYKTNVASQSQGFIPPDPFTNYMTTLASPSLSLFSFFSLSLFLFSLPLSLFSLSPSFIPPDPVSSWPPSFCLPRRSMTNLYSVLLLSRGLLSTPDYPPPRKAATTLPLTPARFPPSLGSYKLFSGSPTPPPPPARGLGVGGLSDTCWSERSNFDP